MFEISLGKKETDKLTKAVKKMDVAKRIFTDTIKKLSEANEELSRVHEQCDEKMTHYATVKKQAESEMQDNEKLIGKIEKILN